MPPTSCHQSFMFHFLNICQRPISTFPTGQPTRILPQCFPWMFILVFPLIRVHIQLTLIASFFLNKVNAIKIRSPLNRISFLNSISCQEAHRHCSGHQGLQEGRMLGPDLPRRARLLRKASTGCPSHTLLLQRVPPRDTTHLCKPARHPHGCSESQQKGRETPGYFIESSS